MECVRSPRVCVGFLPKAPTHVRLIDESNLPIGVSVSVVCLCGPVTDR